MRGGPGSVPGFCLRRRVLNAWRHRCEVVAAELDQQSGVRSAQRLTASRRGGPAAVGEVRRDCMTRVGCDGAQSLTSD